MINLNEKFIDGSWYEEEYREGWYRDRYIEKQEPQWAKECKAYHINCILMFLGLPLTAKILDLGSGVGQFMGAWQERGFGNVHGIEISKTAVSYSNMRNLIQGNVQDMPFKDGEFDLVFSSAFFEHIDESILDDVLKECFRIGIRQAHTLCLEKGTDPSHINMKTAQGWLERFEKHTKDFIFIAPDELLNSAPILLVVPENKITHPLKSRLIRDATHN